MKKLIETLKTKIKQLTCRHNYQWFRDPRGMNLNGEMRYLVCTKCEHIKSSFLAEYEGGGFK